MSDKEMQGQYSFFEGNLALKAELLTDWVFKRENHPVRLTKQLQFCDSKAFSSLTVVLSGELVKAEAAATRVAKTANFILMS